MAEAPLVGDVWKAKHRLGFCKVAKVSAQSVWTHGCAPDGSAPPNGELFCTRIFSLHYGYELHSRPQRSVEDAEAKP